MNKRQKGKRQKAKGKRRLMQYLWNSVAPEPVNPTNDHDPDPDVCPVCLEVPGTKNVSITKCGHIFCTSCLLSSLTQKNTCPTCRAELEPERTVITPVSVSVVTEIIREEEYSMNLSRRIGAIQSFGGTNGRSSMIFSLCREVAFATAHRIARWQKTNPNNQTYHNSWVMFDSSDDDDNNDDNDTNDNID